MKLEILLQFIVPLTFLAIWALTSLLNREAQPLPPRPAHGPVPGGGRPGMGAPLAGRGDPSGQSRYPANRRPPAPVAERPAQARWSGTPVQGRSGSTMRPGGADDGIVILESETRTSQASTSSFSPSSTAASRSARTAPARRNARGRAPQAAPLKAIEPERPRLLTGLSKPRSHREEVPAPRDHAPIDPDLPDRFSDSPGLAGDYPRSALRDLHQDSADPHQ